MAIKWKRTFEAPPRIVDGVHAALVGHFLHRAHVLPRIEQGRDQKQRDRQPRHAAKHEKYRERVNGFHR